MTDTLARLNCIILDLREASEEIGETLTALDHEIGDLIRRMHVGVGCTDKSATIQGGDIDIDADGFALMRPDDGDPETGLHP